MSGGSADSSPTRTHSGAPAPAGVRFAPGVVLADRYRIVALLGKGGMGEVYRADDLKLEKAVALKFLPASLADDPARLARFHNEVRVAQDVTHPNVCRVHDIGEAGGAPFLSMEYVDGEDLSSLLRRIGRLPRDKGVEIARQLCAGLAAAHDRGVLHRDLKPANVMLDGRGRVRITDFGLAGLADRTSRDDVASGTPAYMAPEQAAGRQVSVKSDLYALGLVLYEVFTGKPAFSGASRAELLRAHHDKTPTNPSDHVAELDPAIERVILRCLEKDPGDRPASALAVAAALPGGDPLAAALAAGETPSPEMVAAAGEVGALAPKVALRWLAAAALLALAYYGVYFGIRLHLIQRVPMELSPETLASRARDVLSKLSVLGGGPHRAFGLRYERGILAYIAQREETTARIEGIASGRPAVVHLWYRESPSPFFSRIDLGYVTPQEPATVVPGMVTLELDTKGRLLSLRAVPPRHLVAREAPPPPDWAALFDAAGLELSRFERAAPEWVPPAFADERAAWVGGYGVVPEIEVRVEAATFRGRPVHFEILGPWSVGAPARLPSLAFRNAVVVLLPLTVVFLAWRNLRLGRGDRRGARRLASFVFTLLLLEWLFMADHTSDVFLEWSLFTRGVAWGLFSGGFFWAFYVAVEPYVRRLWPESIVAWSRLLAGRYRDPLVGRDVLIGLTLGFAGLLFFSLAVTAHKALAGGPPRVLSTVDLDALLGPRFVIAGLLGSIRGALQTSFLVLSLILILRILLRRPWLVATAFALVFTAIIAPRLGIWSGRLHALDYPLLAAMTALNYLLLTRLGLVSYLAFGLTTFLAVNFPAIAPDLTAWHASSFVVPLLVLAGLAAWAFRTATAGRPVFSDGVFTG